jgi:UPF0716 protein FxsA
MFPRLFLLFTLGPVVELALLLYFAETFGWRVTLATVVGTGLLGAWLVKREGWRAWERMQGELASGKMPGNALIDAMMVFAGGILLITPGVLSDLLGLSLAFPPTRAMIRRLVRYRFQVRGGTLFQSTAQPFERRDSERDHIIDVRLVESVPDSKEDSEG